MKVYRPLKAMRLKCLDCCAGQLAEVRECPIEKCTLWPYRMGHRPTDGEILIDETEQQKTARLTGVFVTKTNLETEERAEYEHEKVISTGIIKD